MALQHNCDVIGNEIFFCFLFLTPGLIFDKAGNPSSVISSTNSIRCTQLTLDTFNPELVSFDLDLNLRTLKLTFTEAVRGSAFSRVEVSEPWFR